MAIEALSDQGRLLFSIFEPARPLIGPLLEACHVERENSPGRRMILSLRRGGQAQKMMLAGQRGSGKTSELVRISHELGKEYFVVWIDVFASIDVHSMTILDLLLAIGGGVTKVARDSGVWTDIAPWQEMLEAISTLVVRDRQAEEHLLDAETLLHALICARSDPAQPLDAERWAGEAKQFSLTLDSATLESLHTGPILREMLARVNQIIEAVTRASGKTLLAIVDGLDKRYEEPEKVFRYSTVMAQLGCHAIFTFPYELYKTPQIALREYFDIFNLPNVALHSGPHSTEKYEPGYETMRSVIEKRLVAAGVELAEFIDATVIDQIILASGGLMRRLMQLMRNAIIRAEDEPIFRIDQKVAELAIQDVRMGILTGISAAERHQLQDFTPRAFLETELLPLLSKLYIVNYARAGRVWYEVDPILLHFGGIESNEKDF